MSSIADPIPMNAPVASPVTIEAASSSQGRLDELGEIIRAYNQVTENLQRSHEALRQQVERLQSQLASADAQLQRSKRLAALGEMAAGIAHEVRNPLAAIGLYAQLLTQDLTDKPELDASKETAVKIASAVRGLDAVVRDVLTFARDIQPRLMAVPIGQALDRALMAHQPAIEAARIAIERPEPDREQTGLLADPDLLQQVLLNLIRNAIDAIESVKTPAKPKRIVFQVDPPPSRGGLATLHVRDSGPGISPDDLDRIFNPFYTTRPTGTGLGLPIVHRIVDAHGGTISAPPCPPSRSCPVQESGGWFRITWPTADTTDGAQA